MGDGRGCLEHEEEQSRRGEELTGIGAGDDPTVTARDGHLTPCTWGAT